MKILRKMSLMVLPVILFAAVLVSCNELKNTFSSGINLTNSEEVKALNELVNKAITPDMVVNKISFSYSERNSSFSFCKDEATITYIDPDNDKVVHGIDVNLKTGDFAQNEFMERKMKGVRGQKGVKLENFDFTKISDIVNAAIQELQKENISVDGIGSFSIDFNSGDPEKMKYQFDLQDKTGSQQMGRRIQYNYNEYSFTADKDGNLKF